MSSDLISRREVITIIENKRLSVGKRDLSVEYTLADVQEKIEKLDVAHDVDKVVEQLQKRKELLEYVRIPKLAKTAAAEAYALAIKDVKAGGAHE